MCSYQWLSHVIKDIVPLRDSLLESSVLVVIVL
jgi:hypothetical protein